ncbi:hypothetical protein FMM75_18600 [Lachnospiraceae bacterium MD335]|jgi:hypothetical protein|nr:hypothetical protein [Lachnospiraceae bacterium MD335]
MNQYDEFKAIIDAYLNQNGKSAEYKSNLHKTSFSDAESVYLYESSQKDLEVINMDSIAQGPYRKIRFPESDKKEDSISTNDAFIICNDNMWYFIEFKNQKLNKTKDSVSKKAYCNWYMLLDIIYEMERKQRLETFWYANPIEFAREHVNFILVISEDKNPMEAKRIQDSITAGERYVPVFLEKLRKYIYHDVFLHTPVTLERYFVKRISLSDL